MAWPSNPRPARSLLTLREQIDALAPGRSRSSDGMIGDTAHKSRSSDHNAWVDDGGVGVVTAIDITHDPHNGVDSGAIAEKLRASHDPRIKYLISNKRIASAAQSPWTWRPYTGSNPHTQHFHLSVNSQKRLYDSTEPWPVGKFTPQPKAPPAIARPLLRKGSRGADVAYLQTLLGLEIDGIFGAETQAAVKQFQRKYGLTPDGIVGAYTWKELL